MTLRPYHYLFLACLTAFLVVAIDAAFEDTAPGDVWLTQQLQSIDSGALADALDAQEDLGATAPLLAVSLIAAALFMRFGGLPPVIVLLAVLPSRWIVTGLKELYERPRPSADQVEIGNQPDSYSFPSGHAYNSVLLYGLIIALAAIYIPHRGIRTLVQAVSAYVVIVICIERIYAGNHWPSDVVGGLALGGMVLALLLWAHDLLRARAEASGRARTS